MRPLPRALAVGLCLAVSHAALAGIIAFDNFGPGDTYEFWGNWFGQGGSTHYQVATDFYPTVSGAMDELWTGMDTSSVSANVITLSVCADQGNKPGPVLWSQTYTGALSIGHGSVLHVAVTGGAELVAGTRYWLLAQAPEDGVSNHSWWANNQGDMGAISLSANHGPWETYPSQTRLTLRVGVVPEPATFGLLVAAALLWRRRG